MSRNEVMLDYTNSVNYQPQRDLKDRLLNIIVDGVTCHWLKPTSFSLRRTENSILAIGLNKF